MDRCVFCGDIFKINNSTSSNPISFCSSKCEQEFNDIDFDKDYKEVMGSLLTVYGVKDSLNYIINPLHLDELAETKRYLANSSDDEVFYLREWRADIEWLIQEVERLKNHVSQYEKALKIISGMKDLKLSNDAIIKRYSDYAKNVLEYKKYTD